MRRNQHNPVRPPDDFIKHRINPVGGFEHAFAIAIGADEILFCLAEFFTVSRCAFIHAEILFNQTRLHSQGNAGHCGNGFGGMVCPLQRG